MATSSQQGEQTQEQNLSKLNLTDATLYIAAITALAYVWSYFREVGNKSYYNLSSMFVELDASTAFKAIGETWQYLVGGFGIVVVCYMMLSAPKINDWLNTNTNCTLLLSIVCFIFPFFVFTNNIVGQLAMILLGFCVLANIIFENNIVKYLIISVSVLSFMFAGHQIGFEQASSEEEYLVLERKTTQKTYVVIDSYGAYFILAPVDEKNKLITPTFELVEQKAIAQQNLILVYKKMGPLKMKH